MKKSLFVCLPLFLALPFVHAQEPTSLPDTTGQNPVATESPARPGRETTGAVTAISAEAFNKGPIIYSPLQLIQGRVPGLAIMRTGGGDPLQAMQVQLRGTSTLFGNPDLLYVIDDVPQASLNVVMPEDIESIEVLRSASATARYGIRGANGVILITTRKGSQGKPLVTYGSFGYFETVSRKARFLTAGEWRGIKQEWANSSDLTRQRLSAAMTDYGASTDWLREIQQRKVSQLHHLSVSGGTAKTRYYAAASYRNLNGVLARSGSSLFNGRISVSQLALKDRLTLSGTFGITPMRYSQYKSLSWFLTNSEYDVIAVAGLYNPTVPLHGNTITNYWSPLRQLNVTSDRHYRNDWLARAEASYRIVKGLTLTASVAGQRLHEKFVYGRADEDEIFGQRNEEIRKRREGDNSRTVETTLNYRFAAAGHHLDLLAGFANQQFRYAGEQRDTVRQNGTVIATSGSNFSGHSRISSWLGSVSYSFKGRYFLSAGLRRDQSPRYNWRYTSQYYPAYHLGWRVRNEAFLRKSSWISELMLRAGYGTAGRQIDLPSGFSGSGLPNAWFHGEKVTELNVGVDFGILAGRIKLHADYYNRVTHDVIVRNNPSLPATGMPLQFILNGGKLRNRGWEVAVNARPVATPAFRWNTALIASFNRNELMFDINQFPNSLMKGQPVGMMYELPFAGFDADGKALYWTQDGRKEYVQIGSDIVAVGNGAPKTHFGFSNTLAWGKLELTLLLRGAAGFQIHNRHRAEHLQDHSLRAGNQLREIKELDLRVVRNSPLLGNNTDYFVEKGDFVKLDNLTLGYSLPLKSRFLQHLKLYASGHNLATLTRFRGLDPEMAGITGITPGVYTRNTYFATRVWSLGLNVSL